MHMPSDSNEAMLRNPQHPSHTSGGRELVWTFGLVTIAGFILCDAADLTWMPFVPYLVVVGLIGAGLGGAFMRFGSRADARHRARNEAEYRKMIEVETRTEIAKMRRADALVSNGTGPARKGE